MSIRQATSAADRLAVMAVWHAATERDEPLAYHQALRLKLLRRHLGTWWILEEGGRVLSSLLCYPLQFAVGEEILPGYGLGAVATRPEGRRKGRAAVLCQRAIEVAEEAGRGIGLLFSAIPPAYYEHLGFRAAPAWHHVCPRAADLATSGVQADLTPLDPRLEIEALLACYRAAHRGLHIARDGEEWHAALVRNADDIFLGLGDPIRGYARLNAEDSEGFDVVELMIAPEEQAAALRSIAALATAMGRQIVEGWFDPVPDLASHFEDRGRATTHPMLRGISEIDDARFWGSDYF